jgi:hypothetical protein
MTIRGFAYLTNTTVPPLPSFSERDAPFVRQIGERKTQACAKAMLRQQIGFQSGRVDTMEVTIGSVTGAKFRRTIRE